MSTAHPCTDPHDWTHSTATPPTGATALRLCTNRRTGRIANVQQVVDECRREDAILVAVLERRADESAELLGRVELDCDIPHRFHQDDRGLARHPTLPAEGAPLYGCRWSYRPETLRARRLIEHRDQR
jgi:hypothetical protein